MAFSLHSCFEDIRNRIMPVNKKYSLKENIAALKYYSRQTGTRITFEYIMLKNINDRDEDIKALVKLCREIPSKINVIPFNSLKHMNPTGISAELEASPKHRIEEFSQSLREKDVTVIVRLTQGEDIAAACGQLAYPQMKSELSASRISKNLKRSPEKI
jgi:23S rRNA (adenine2503-C2)-methyltransferase